MQDLLHSLGIEGKLLLAQSVNFLLVIVILRLTVYKPLIKILAERKSKIEKGLKDAEAAGDKLAGIEILERERLAEAEKEALIVLQKTENQARKKEVEILEMAHKKENDILENAARAAKVKQNEADEEVYEAAKQMIKEAMIRTVKLKPEQVDDALVSDVVDKLTAAR